MGLATPRAAYNVRLSNSSVWDIYVAQELFGKQGSFQPSDRAVAKAIVLSSILTTVATGARQLFSQAQDDVTL